jgi:coproporphyrinogen III oxidase-like Fe-S oxidoreductase
MTMMGLRLTAGVARVDFERVAGASIEHTFDRAALARLVDGEFLVVDETGIRATADGRARLNAVLAALLP